MPTTTLVHRAPASSRAHSPERVPLWRYVLQGDVRTWLSLPVIYSVLVPLLLLDAWISAFQAICFRAWGIRLVRRRHFLVVDRHRLPYLNPLEKMNCLFCSYANGLFAYVGEIAARTEQYWCPIKHARRVRGSHRRYDGFTPYGDGRAYRAELARLRAAIKR